MDSTLTKNPQQFEKTYKRKGAGSTQIMSEAEEENQLRSKR
jgi:hypothetical protein